MAWASREGEDDPLGGVEEGVVEGEEEVVLENGMSESEWLLSSMYMT
jgi:hypothetical protein